MARFKLSQAFHFQSTRVKAGGTLADSIANSQPGDAVWTGLTSATVPAGAVALDASATTMYNASRWASVSAWGVPSGRDSIDA
jgi:hypothetical protein